MFFTPCRPRFRRRLVSPLRWWVEVLGLGLVANLFAADPGADDLAARRWAQYEPAFQAFAEADRARPPVPGGIVFVGSSIFRQWADLSEQLAPLPVLNRAFGGSRTADQLARFEQTIPPYAPRLIVYYCGSNDLNAEHSPAEIAANVHAFATRVRDRLPGTQIYFTSILRAPQKEAKWDQVDATNALVRDLCATEARWHFIDLNPAVFDAAGQPLVELYRDDLLHYQPPAYAAFAGILRPVLERAWAQLGPFSPLP